MITEDYISYETAKLLKEKGFDVYVRSYYEKNEYKTKEEFSENNALWNWNISGFRYSAPTLQMAMKWLRDVHDLIISVNFTVHGWLCDITKVFRDPNGFIVNINHGISDDSFPYCDEHEEACEVAIKYCLENLI